MNIQIGKTYYSLHNKFFKIIARSDNVHDKAFPFIGTCLSHMQHVYVNSKGHTRGFHGGNSFLCAKPRSVKKVEYVAVS